LIAAIHPDPERFAEIVATEGSRADWGWVLQRASAHRVAALFAARMDANALPPRLDEDLQQRLRDIQRDAQARTRAAERTLREIAAQFGRAGIPFLLIKGSVLAERLYGNPALRPFEDVDVVVRPDAVAAAEQVLRSLGYRFGQIRQLLAARPAEGAEARVAEAVTRRFYERFHYEFPLVPARGDGRLPVDLHWHVAPSARLRIGTAQLWEQTTPVVVADTPITTLSAEATLLHLVVHATTCSLAGFKLLPLCDIAWATTRFGSQYRGVWDLAGAWGVGSHVESVLEIVDRVLGVPLPPALRADVRPRFARGPGFATVAQAIFLVDYRSNADVSGLRRAYAELVWNLAMRCLRYNLTRGVRVRLSRLRWRVERWRARRSDKPIRR